MFNDLYHTLSQPDQYLERMRWAHPLKVDRETLDTLIAAHMHTVPFENLDIYDYNLEIPLGTEALFDKLVVRRRGGYCFELNALFMSLLQSLGFVCHARWARVMWNKDYMTPPGHRITVVELEGDLLLCDVGFGGPTPAASVSMQPGLVQQTGAGTFVFQRQEDRGELLLCKMLDGAPAPLLSITERPSDLVDFVPLNEYFSKNAGSFFRSKRMANIQTESGSAAIDGDILRIRNKEGVHETQLDTPEQRNHALQQYFGISIP